MSNIKTKDQVLEMLADGFKLAFPKAHPDWSYAQWVNLAQQFVEAMAMQVSEDDTELKRAVEARCPTCHEWLEAYCEEHGHVFDILDQIEWDRDAALVRLDFWKRQFAILEQRNVDHDAKLSEYEKRYDDLRQHMIKRDDENMRLKEELARVRTQLDKKVEKRDPWRPKPFDRYWLMQGGEEIAEIMVRNIRLEMYDPHQPRQIQIEGEIIDSRKSD